MKKFDDWVVYKKTLDFIGGFYSRRNPYWIRVEDLKDLKKASHWYDHLQDKIWFDDKCKIAFLKAVSFIRLGETNENT